MSPLSSWRTGSVQGEMTGGVNEHDDPAQLAQYGLGSTADKHEKALSTARVRIKQMEDDYLEHFLDDNIGGVARDIANYRRTGDRAHIEQALLAIQIEEAAIRELARR